MPKRNAIYYRRGAVERGTGNGYRCPDCGADFDRPAWRKPA
jgi:hypothetical protein